MVNVATNYWLIVSAKRQTEHVDKLHSEAGIHIEYVKCSPVVIYMHPLILSININYCYVISWNETYKLISCNNEIVIETFNVKESYIWQFISQNSVIYITVNKWMYTYIKFEVPHAFQENSFFFLLIFRELDVV